MRLNKAQLIGLFTIVVVLALYAVITFLKDENLFNGKSTYYIIYEDVDGLKTSSPVYIKGFKVGSIWDIEFDNKSGLFTVLIKVKSSFEIPSNSVATIAGSGILGGKQINLALGDSKVCLSSKDTICGGFEIDAIASVMKNAAPIAGKMDTLLSSLNSVVGKMDRILDENAQRELQQSITSLNASMANIRSITATLKKSAPEVEEILKNVKLLTDNLNVGSQDLNQTLKNANTITKGLSEADLKGTIEELKGLMAKIQNPEGTLGKLMETDTLHNALTSMLNSISDLVQKIEANPKKYIKISVF